MYQIEAKKSGIPPKFVATRAKHMITRRVTPSFNKIEVLRNSSKTGIANPRELLGAKLRTRSAELETKMW
jgi:hypothetical protein